MFFSRFTVIPLYMEVLVLPIRVLTVRASVSVVLVPIRHGSCHGERSYKV